MPKPLCLLCADTHLAERAWELAAGRDISGDSFESFRQIVDLAIKYNVPIIGAGDLIDKQINRSQTIVYLMHQLDRLQAAGLKFYHVAGQHDLSDPNWFTGHAAGEHLAGRLIKLGTVQFYGLDYTASPLLQVALSSLDSETDVLIAHQVWSDLLAVGNPQGSFHDVPIAKVMFTGDYHVNVVHDVRGKDGQKLKVISPGSTCMQDIAEPVDKYVYFCMDDFTWKKAKLKTRRKLEWSLTHCGDVDTFLQEISKELAAVAQETAGFAESIRKPLLRITYKHTLAEHRMRMLNAVGKTAHLFWKEIPPEPNAIVSLRRTKAKTAGQRRASTLATELRAYLESTGQLNLLADCDRLLQAENIGGELTRMFKEGLE